MGRPHGTAVAIRAAISLLATVVIACSAPSIGPLARGGMDLLSPAAATQVVKDYWAVNERAAMAHDLDRFAQAETGLLLEADRGQVQANRALAEPPIPKPRPLRRVTTYVPHQHHYPLQFLALLETVKVDAGGQFTGTPAAIYLHFARPSAKDPWKADFYAAADLAHLAHLALDHDGYATTLSGQEKGLVLPPAQVSGAYKAYMESGIKTGTPAGPFRAGDLTSGAVTQLRTHDAFMGSRGFRTTTVYLDREMVQAYRATGGGAVVLYAVEPADVVTVPPGHCIIQPADLSQWGGLVPAGVYSSIGIFDVLQMVAEDQPARAGAQINVLSAADDQVSAQTEPGPPGCS